METRQLVMAGMICPHCGSEMEWTGQEPVHNPSSPITQAMETTWECPCGYWCVFSSVTMEVCDEGYDSSTAEWDDVGQELLPAGSELLRGILERP